MIENGVPLGEQLAGGRKCAGGYPLPRIVEDDAAAAAAKLPVAHTIVDVIRYACTNRPEHTCYFSLEEDLRFRTVSWHEHGNAVLTLASFLRQLGLACGERVALIGPSNADWFVAQHAILCAGGVVVGIDPSEPASQIADILDHAAPAGVVLTDEALCTALPEEQLANQRFVVIRSDESSWNAGGTEQSSAQFQSEHAASWGGLSHVLCGDSPATLLYTSGTTGKRKGVLYSHAQLIFACDALCEALKVREGHVGISWLPLHHMYQRMANLAMIRTGGVICFVDTPAQVVPALKLVKPTIHFGIPRFYENLCDAARQNLSAGIPGPIDPQRLRSLVGPNMRWMITGSAPTPGHVLEAFREAGIGILEAYGVTECALPIAINTPDFSSPGTVGRPLPQNQVRISDRGEVLVKGPALFDGYFGERQRRDIFDVEGFYRTGDLGRIDENGAIHLLGRRDELIKTSTGRRISLPYVESNYRALSYVEHVIVVGRGRKCLTAILSVNCKRLCQRAGKKHYQELSQIPASCLLELLRTVQADCANCAQDNASYLRVAGLLLATEPFSRAGGELTATNKLRRSYIESKYTLKLDQFYSELSRAEGLENEDLPRIQLL